MKSVSAILLVLLFQGGWPNGELVDKLTSATQVENDPKIEELLVKRITRPADFDGPADPTHPSDATNSTDGPSSRSESDHASGNHQTVSGVIPGLIGAIQHCGEPLRIGAAGVRKWKSDEPIQTGDLVHIGSCTKAITATMIGRLIDQGKLSFDLTIREGLPHLVDRIHPDYHEVTLHQLLMHRGGVPREGNWQNHADKNITECRESIVVDALARKPEKNPGTQFAYSNLGYVVASLMACRVEGKSWEALMQREIFDVLSMDSAGFGPPGTDGTLDQPWGHTAFAKGAIANQLDNPPSLGPAGTIHLTVSDWLKFAFEHAGCGEKPIVSPEVLQQLQAVPDADAKDNRNAEDPPYACGWIVVNRPWGKGRVLTHTGSNNMWTSTIWVAPETRTVYAVVCNAGTGEHINAIVDQLIGELVALDR